jgi:hypothetical protein
MRGKAGIRGRRVKELKERGGTIEEGMRGRLEEGMVGMRGRQEEGSRRE